MRIILFQPQIPQNTGNIVRTCAVTGTSLSLVGPLGFSVTDRWLKRAGLDYWEGAEVSFMEAGEFEHFLETTTHKFYFFSSKVETKYSDVCYKSDDILIFGSETSGLPAHFLEKWGDRFVTIPMIDGARCLNLATSVGICLYEAWRQLGYQTTVK